MRRTFFACTLLLAAAATPSASQPSERKSAEAALAALDLRQKDMVAKADVDGLAALSASDLTINAVNRRAKRTPYRRPKGTPLRSSVTV